MLPLRPVILAMTAACLLALCACSGKGGAAAAAGNGPPTDTEVVAAFKARTDRQNAGQSEKFNVVSVTYRKCTPLADPSKYDCELEVETRLTPSVPPIKGTNQDVPS